MNMSNHPGVVPLTRTELKCLALVSEGSTDEVIGRELTLSKKEVSQVMLVSLKKLGVSNRMAAIAKATRLGLIGLENQSDPSE